MPAGVAGDGIAPGSCSVAGEIADRSAVRNLAGCDLPDVFVLRILDVLRHIVEDFLDVVLCRVGLARDPTFLLDFAKLHEYAVAERHIVEPGNRVVHEVVEERDHFR